MQFSYLQKVRRELHKIPELGYQEKRTSAYIRKELSRLGVPFRAGMAKTGVVATIGHGKPCVMFRADMDGLGIEEETKLPFRSRHKGVTHACGHDGHMAVLLGLAKVLKEHEKKLHGTAVLVFQPAEEGGAGAKKMIGEGIVKKYRPDIFFSFHLANDRPTGAVRARAGLQQAGARRYEVIFHGPGGHAAYLSTTRDVIKAAREFCASLENIGREVFPWHKTPIVHVGILQAGTAANAVAHEAIIKGTMRVQESEDLRILCRAIAHRAERIAHLHELSAPEVKFGTGYVPLVNDHAATELVKKIAHEGGYEFQTLTVHAGADDAAFFLEKIPGCHFKVSARKAGAGSHHSPTFDFDEHAMEVALDMYYGLAKSILTRHRSL